MDLSKSFEYFDPNLAKGKCHIIGCGSVGSTLAELLTRIGIKNFALYEFDTIEPHNIGNQLFVNADIGKTKIEATKKIITDINPETEQTIELYPKGYTDQPLDGYVFLCVDNIDLRRQICEMHKMNRSIKLMFDFRTGLTSAQHYAADWGDLRQVKAILSTMAFTHEEAQSITPTTACGLALGLAPTVRMVCTLGVCNFMNYLLGKGLKQMVVCDPFEMEIY